MTKLGGQNSKIPEPTDIKSDIVDYVGNVTCKLKMKVIAPLGASRQIDEILLSCSFWVTACKTVHHAIGPLSCPVCDVGALWPHCAR